MPIVRRIPKHVKFDGLADPIDTYRQSKRHTTQACLVNFAHGAGQVSMGLAHQEPDLLVLGKANMTLGLNGAALSQRSLAKTFPDPPKLPPAEGKTFWQAWKGNYFNANVQAVDYPVKRPGWFAGSSATSAFDALFSNVAEPFWQRWKGNYANAQIEGAQTPILHSTTSFVKSLKTPRSAVEKARATANRQQRINNIRYA